MTVQPLRSRVAIVGTAPSWVEAPFSDRDVEVWGQNGCWQVLPRCDRFFEMHTPAERELFVGWFGAGYADWLASMHGPVYMAQAVEWIPRSVPYPVAAIVAEFGEVFASTVGYMVALAIREGFREISLFGIEMTGTGEYLMQREWLQRLLGVAQGRGISVRMADGCSLSGLAYRYGYSEPPGVPGAVADAATLERARAMQACRMAEIEEARAEAAQKVVLDVQRRLANGGIPAGYFEGSMRVLAEHREQARARRLEARGSIDGLSRLGKTLEHMARGGAA